MKELILTNGKKIHDFSFSCSKTAYSDGIEIKAWTIQSIVNKNGKNATLIGTVDLHNNKFHNGHLTVEERKEIAEYVIKQWVIYLDGLGGKNEKSQL